MKTLNNYQLEITKELACGDEEKFYQDEFMIEHYEDCLGESDSNGGFAYDAFILQREDSFSLEKEIEEFLAEMEEEALKDDYEKVKDILNELRAEEYEAMESARAEEQEKKEREEQEFFELLEKTRRMSAEELVELNSKNTEKGEF